MKVFVDKSMISSPRTSAIHPGLRAAAGCLPIWKADGNRKECRQGTGRSCCPKPGSRGFTLIELMTIIVIIGALSAIAIPAYNYYIQKSKVTEAIVELRYMERDIIVFFNDNSRYPNNLAEIGLGGSLDPWGNPYQYLDVTTAVGLGQCRSNKFNNPINSDFDLFSMGRDGVFQRPLTGQLSRDDVVRADNGRFVGLATDL